MSIDSFSRLPQVPAPGSTPRHDAIQPSTAKHPAGAFERILERESAVTPPLNFSAHAQSRLVSRNIQLTDTQIARLERGVDQAASKGAKDSLVMLDNLAFIISVSNRKVVTAMDGAQSSGNVFTQIDSAVVV